MRLHGLLKLSFSTCFRVRVNKMTTQLSTMKPPNVLILQDSEETVSSKRKGTDSRFLPLREALNSCLNPQRYVVYPLPLEDVARTPWRENCLLFVVPPQVKVGNACHEIVSYVRGGGLLLSMQKELNEQLGFRFQDLSSVREPAHLPNVRVLSESYVTDSNSVPSAAFVPSLKLYSSITFCAPSIWNGSITTVNEIGQVESTELTNDLLESEVVSRENLAVFHHESSAESGDGYTLVTSRETGHNAESVAPTSPCFQKVVFRSGGVAFLSYMDVLPLIHEESDISKLVQLKRDTEIRTDFLRTVLNGAGLECSSTAAPDLTHTYLVCSEKNCSQFCSIVDKLQTNCCIKGSEMDIRLVDTDFSQGTPVDPLPQPAQNQLCVLLRPAQWQLQSVLFNFEEYFHHLRTAHLGRTVLHTPVISSTQTVFTGNVPFCSSLTSELGVVCVAGQQTRGKGRHGNFWISPLGSMMFSACLKFPPGSRLYHRMPLLQHIVALAVVSGIRTIPGYEELPVGIKWPNDIYYKDQVKLGGILVSCFSFGSDTTLTAVIGCGVNISNEHPTMSVNDCIRIHNFNAATHRKPLPLLSIERTLALTFNQLEMYLGKYETLELGAIEDMYYKYWLHSGAKVKLASRQNEEVTIVGINEYGYLRVKCTSGQELLLQPDGNSFDIMKGLIVMK